MADNSYIVAYWDYYDDMGTRLPYGFLQLRVGYSGSEQWPKDYSVNYSPMTGQGKDAAFSPDGTRLAGVDEFGTVMAWNTRSGENVFTTNNPDDFSIGGQILWSPDGDLIAVWGKQHPITIIDARTGGLMATLQPSDLHTYFPTWSPDSHRIAVSSDGIVTIWTR